MNSPEHQQSNTEQSGIRKPAHTLREVKDISEWGFTIFTPQGGRTRFEGLLSDDELCESSVFGLLNISEAWRCISPASEPTRVGITEELKLNIARIVFDPEYSASLSIPRRAQPILMAPGPDGWHVVDGIHRLQRRIADGLPTVKCFHITPKMVQHIRVRRFAWVRNKAWAADDSVREAKFRQVIRGGKAFLAASKNN